MVKSYQYRIAANAWSWGVYASLLCLPDHLSSPMNNYYKLENGPVAAYNIAVVENNFWVGSSCGPPRIVTHCNRIFLLETSRHIPSLTGIHSCCSSMCGMSQQLWQDRQNMECLAIQSVCFLHHRWLIVHLCVMWFWHDLVPPTQCVNNDITGWDCWCTLAMVITGQWNPSLPLIPI